MKRTDTIAAISTPIGVGGIGVVRISGAHAFIAGKSVFRARGPVNGGSPLKERFLNYGHFIDPGDGAVLDDGFLICMKGPGSYTGEDVVELHCHGGPYVLKRVLEAVLKDNVRVAEPGEFTKRAFLNGRLDLTQAEAVNDVIKAGSEEALRSARGRLEGGLSRRINGAKEALAGLLTLLEAELDFPEDEPGGDGGAGGITTETLSQELDRAGTLIKRLIESYDEGSVLKDGIRTLILGRPNAGKSSLLNILLEEERAIVTEVPGTTRDVIEEVLNIKGVSVRLMDTAGLRETADRVEAVGIRAALSKIEAAGLIVFVVDASERGGFSEDLRLLKETGAEKTIVAVNKIDLVDSAWVEGIKGVFKGYKTVCISALREEGIGELKDLIYEEAVGHPRSISRDADAGELVASVRQKSSLIGALEALERTKGSVREGLQREFLASDLRSALNRLGEITGEVTTEDILDRIFNQFCIGK